MLCISYQVLFGSPSRSCEVSMRPNHPFASISQPFPELISS
jgi:hypothetical protein